MTGSDGSDMKDLDSNARLSGQGRCRMHRQILVLAAALVCLTVILGCGDDGGTDVEITRPTVTQTSPENGATGVGMVPLITVSFS